MSGNASAASEGLAAQNKGKAVAEIQSQSKRKPDAENHSEIERETVQEFPSKSEREPDPNIPSKNERDPVPEIPSQSEGEPIAEMQQRLTGPSLRGISEEDPHVRVQSSRDSSIFKIRDSDKETKREAYVPEKVLLGPYHHGSKSLRAMDHYRETVKQTRFNEDFARNLIKAILDREDEIRDSYEDTINWDGEPLAMMLCLDACFILDVLKNLDSYALNHQFWEQMIPAPNDMKEILMLENQIPWIVLRELLRLENPEDDNINTNLLNVMVKGICGLLIISTEDRTPLLRIDWLEAVGTKVHHLLDLVHKVIVFRPPNQANPRNEGEHRISIQMPAGRNNAPNHAFESIPTAVELKNAGIKFRPCNGGIWQIYFDSDSSTIYLPPLSVTYDTEVLFRNLIAFEKYRSECYCVNSYVNLMDDLIHSQNDVAFLRSMGILTEPVMTDKEVADLFNGVFKGVTVPMPDMCAELRKEVNTDYESRCGKCKNKIRVQLADLGRDHFSSPCKALGFLVMFATLCLGIIQTIYSVKN